MKLRLLPLVAALVVTAGVPSPGFAQTKPPVSLGQLSIEDLMNVEVTAASRKGQRTEDVAAAVFVITDEDIRYSGMTTIPDLLRLVPGVQVAQINASKWAVSVRGFNGLYADKLLVQIDGRSVYNRLFSGVFWDAQDLMLDDIERIEVIRGPGAALWGANAVNGVINIVTKAAADTQGGLVRVDAGTQGQQVAARYGGTVGATTYRLFAQWTGRDESLIVPGVGANDSSHSTTTGFRAEWATKPGAFMLEGAYTAGVSRGLWLNMDPLTAGRDPIVHVPSDTTGGHVLGRWNLRRASGASWQVQSFFDVATRNEPVGDYHRQVFDVDTQYRRLIGGRHDLVAGAGYRVAVERLGAKGGISLVPEESHISLWTAFVMDEMSLLDNRLTIAIGSQVQQDSSAGAGVQPTARVMWKGLRRQRVWAAASRALRTPSLKDLGIRVTIPQPPVVGQLPLLLDVQGNPEAETERFVDAEAGYRLEIGTVASIEVTGFVGRYGGLQTQEPSAPVVEFLPFPHVRSMSAFGNLLDATTRGLEVTGRWLPASDWHLEGSFTTFHVTPRLRAISLDPAAATADATAPTSQWRVSAAYAPGTRTTLSGSLFHVGRLRELNVDAYTRADVTAELRLTSRLAVMAIGQNLFDAAHPEHAGANSLVLATQVPRSVSVRLRWTFQ